MSAADRLANLLKNSLIRVCVLEEQLEAAQAELAALKEKEKQDAS